MSITFETAKQHQNDPAVLCCLRKKGTVISAADLEDPSIFPDLEESGLLSVPEQALTIGQVLGATLEQDADSMTPLTPELVGHFSENPKNKSEEITTSSSTAEGPIQEKQVIRFNIDKLVGQIELPTGLNMSTLPFAATASKTSEDKVIRTLTQRTYPVEQVCVGAETSFENKMLTIRETLCNESLKADPLVKKVALDIIRPENRHLYSNTIMDVIPIGTKVEGILGEGITHVMNGVVIILTGVDEKGVQVHEFGSCEGYLDEKIRFGRPGSPDPEDIMIRINVTVQENTGMERRGPFAAHKACDYIIQEIRDVLKEAPADTATDQKVFRDWKKSGKPRVMLVKEIMGQGAMHDNVLLPAEPAGVIGGRRNVDLGNVPVVLSPNEVRDGGIHALTCIGPATKEVTRHYFREPLVNLMAEDDEIDLAGVVFIGSPQVNDEKTYVSARLGALAEALDVEGAIVTTEGFGNNHIDFAENIEQIGRRGIKVVGVSYCAYQGQLVVGNQYMDAMVELNKDPKGFENEILADSTLCPADAERALIMLKTKMAGIPIEPANRKWSQEVVDSNQQLIP
ncbi:D-proline reductase (dithiol) proprotein PrdA [Sporolactobacillus shoreicorticis]|uniref:D-proline reductase (Dithiol) proprotein PrdA n=1 Tax=Sporolactobacillus shoreicorticis TaxID=1923877 RepID=A0ABW5RYU1_9BACL|nr:D-proline reductase (dithiol) proprotein PrdA [Sporolactobacillus shoreicorticis]MCO7127603.1 D-proline reductase (dithiol) proprotein PrdA [Sporolactobacillus shoreicorticis]